MHSLVIFEIRSYATDYMPIQLQIDLDWTVFLMYALTMKSGKLQLFTASNIHIVKQKEIAC